MGKASMLLSKFPLLRMLGITSFAPSLLKQALVPWLVPWQTWARRQNRMDPPCSSSRLPRRPCLSRFLPLDLGVSSSLRGGSSLCTLGSFNLMLVALQPLPVTNPAAILGGPHPAHTRAFWSLDLHFSAFALPLLFTNQPTLLATSWTCHHPKQSHLWHFNT